LGLIVAYELLRREEGRTVAVVSSILLASSPRIFGLATRMVFSDLPYLFTSMSALLLATRLDRTIRFRSRAILWPLCGFALVGSQLIRSAGIALVVGLFGWLVASVVTDRPTTIKRLKTFVPLVVVGLVAQGLWMHWASTREVLEWPTVGGYPHS